MNLTRLAEITHHNANYKKDALVDELIEAVREEKRYMEGILHYIDHPNHAFETNINAIKVINLISAYRYLDAVLKENGMISIRKNGEKVQIFWHGPKGEEGDSIEEILLRKIK